MSQPQKVGSILGVALLLGSIGVAALSLGGGSQVQAWLAPTGSSSERAARANHDSVAELVPGQPDTLYLPPDVAQKLGIRTAAVQKATQVRSLVLAGSLALESNRLARVHTRFAGEVVELGSAPEPTTGLA